MAKILVVDDSPTQMQIMVNALAETGHNILTARDGEEALQKAAKERPDVVLLDVILPNRNGFQVCRQLKSDEATKNIKIILVTSKDQKSDRFWGLKQGADDYLTKPFDDTTLLASVSRWLA